MSNQINSESLVPDLTIQLNLFCNVYCSMCKTNPGPSDKNPNLWNGFLDQDTKQHVCNNCKEAHYQLKFNNPKTNGLYSEVPVGI